VFAVSPGGVLLWFVFLAEQMVEANYQQIVGPQQLHLDLGVSKQVMVRLAAMKKAIYSTSLFAGPTFMNFKAIFLIFKASQLVSNAVGRLPGLCGVDE
jgi:hypothetical protein